MASEDIVIDEDTVFDDTIKATPLLSEEKKRPLSSTNVVIYSHTRRQRQSNSLSIGCLTIHEEKVFELVAKEQCKYSLESGVDDDDGTVCSILEIYHGEIFNWFQKSHVSLINHATPSFKNSSNAASFLLKTPMLFKSDKNICFVIDYTGGDSNIFQFSNSEPSSELLSWNHQLFRSCMSAPKIPADFSGALILLGILPQEGVVLLGSQRELSSEYGSGISSGNAIVFYANNTTEGRGLSLYLEAGRRLHDTKMRSYHYLSANCTGSFPSCFYHCRNKKVALPLTLQKDSFSLTPERNNSLVCLQLLKEMNGSILSSSPVAKKRKRHSVENPLTTPQKSTKWKLYITPAERIFLLLHKGGVATQTGSRISSLSTLSTFPLVSSVSSSSLSSSSSSPLSSSSLNLIPNHDVPTMISSQIKEKLSFEEFTGRVDSFGKGNLLMNSFDPTQEQIQMFTSPDISIDVLKSVAADKVEDSKNRKCCVDIDQIVFAATRLLPSIFESILSPSLQLCSVSTDNTYDDIIADLQTGPERMNFLEPSLMAGMSRKISASSRTSLLSTSVHQFKTSLNIKPLDDAIRVVDILNREVPHHQLMANTRVDAVLKNVTRYSHKFRSSRFDQFSHLVTSDFVNINLGKHFADAPLLVAIRASVVEVKQAVMDLVSAWRNRGENPTSSESTSAEKACDSYPKWGSSDEFEIVTISLQSLQVGTALLVMARKQQQQTNFDNQTVNFICESYNQKRNAHYTSFKMDDGESVHSLADESFLSRRDEAVFELNNIYEKSFFSLIPKLFSPSDCKCCLSIGVMVESDKLTFALPTAVSSRSRSFSSGFQGLEIINSRLSTLPVTVTQPRKTKSSLLFPVATKDKKVAMYSIFPVLALPPGLHGSMVSFRDSATSGDIASVQTYSQLARYCPKTQTVYEKTTENAMLDLHQLRSSVLATKINIEKMLYGMMKHKSLRFRAEIGVCVAGLDVDGISLAVTNSLQFYSKHVVPFNTSVLIRFSCMWASVAVNLNLLAIQCLTDPLSDLSNRLVHISLSMFFSDLLRQYVTGRTFSPTSKLYVEAAKTLNFPLLARPSQQMSIFLRCSPVSLPSIKDTVFSSANQHASNRGKGHLCALESFRAYPQCLNCGTNFVCCSELFDHLNENPSHKSDNTEVTMVSLQVSSWLQDTMKDLDDDQKEMIELYLQGHHILLIAGAGCGKTHVTKRLIRLIFAMYGEEWCQNHVVGVAMTNAIANNMNCLSFEAQTIFSYLGLGLGKKEKTCEQYMEFFLRNLKEDRRQNLLNLKLLFGDESFLFSNLIFAVFYMIFEYLFESSEVCPLAYLQICFIGDPKQLLVFDKDGTLAKNFCFVKGVCDLDGDEFFSKFFNKLLLTGLRILFLNVCHRTVESEFLETLNEIRNGEWNEVLRNKVSQFGKGDGSPEDATDIDLIKFTSSVSATGTTIERADDAHYHNVLVACLKKDRVLQYNDRGLSSASKDDIKIFSSFDCYSKSSNLIRCSINYQLDRCLDIPYQVTLAKGCPVRVCREVEAFRGDSCITIPKNSFGIFLNEIVDDKDYLNSAAKVQFEVRGKKWISDVKFAFEQFDVSDLNINGLTKFFETFSHRYYMPLEVAYCVTMTSLQGRELDNLIFDLHDIGPWIRHVLYMGLTRVRSSKGIRCLNIPEKESLFNKNDHEIVQLYKKLEEISENQKSSDSNRKGSFLTMDFVDCLENFKPIRFDPKQDVNSQASKFVQDLLK